MLFALYFVGIGSLNILETLDVSSNLLSHLPSCIGRLNSLDSLLVSDNKLVAIPKGELDKSTQQAAYSQEVHRNRGS